MYVCRHLKESLFLSYFKETWILSTDIRKISDTSAKEDNSFRNHIR